MLSLEQELIDTLWNVNKINKTFELSSVYGINRYIMECKCCHCLKSLKVNQELIDTLWNVNLLLLKYEDSKPSELIDTLWNVNTI